MESEEKNINNNPEIENKMDPIEIKERNSIKQISSNIVKELESASPQSNSNGDNLNKQKEEVFNDFNLEPTETHKLISLLQKKLKTITNYYDFSIAYISIITKIYRIFYQTLIKKLTNTLDQNKKIIKFFKEITNAYQRFSSDLIKANSAVTEINQDQIFSNNVNSIIEKSQETIANNFLGFSKVLQSNIVLKGPLAKIDEFYKRLSSIDKEIISNFGKTQTKKEKLERLFNEKHNKLIEQLNKFFKELEKVQDKGKFKEIIQNNDFFLVEMETMGAFKGLYESVSEFFTLFKVQMKSAIQLTSDYLQIIKESMEIYIGENKKIFSGQSEFNFENVQKFYDNLNETLQANFSPVNILTDPIMIQSFNDALKDYQMNFINRDVTVFKDLSLNDYLKNDDNFKIGKFKTIDEFAEFFISFKPEITEGYYNSHLKEFEMELKRDPGIFSRWKNCILIITKQKNILVFDDEGTTITYVDQINLEKIKLKLKEEKKYPYRFEISEIKKGFIIDSSTSFKLDCVTKEKFDELMKIISINPNITSNNSYRKNTTESQKEAKEIKEDFVQQNQN